MRKFVPGMIMYAAADPPHTFARHSWGKTVAYVCVGLCLVGVGVLAGFFAGRDSKPANYATGTTSATARPHAVDISPDGLVEMPEYDSPDAAAMMSDPATPDIMRDMFFMWKDSQQITPQLTRSFIQAMRQQLSANQQLLGGRDPETLVNWKTLDRVARDILGYLRYTRSVAILELLRQFCASGGASLSITDVDPDALRQEISALLNMTTLNSYYAKMSDKGCDRSKDRRKPRAVGDILSVLESATAAQAPAGRHLSHHHDFDLHQDHHIHHPRSLQQLAAPEGNLTNTSAATSKPRCFDTATNSLNVSNSTDSSSVNSSSANATDAGSDERERRRGGGPSLQSILSSESAGPLPRRHLLHVEHKSQQHRQLQQAPAPANTSSSSSPSQSPSPTTSPSGATASQAQATTSPHAATPSPSNHVSGNASQTGDDARLRRRSDVEPSIDSIMYPETGGVGLPRRHMLHHQDDKLDQPALRRHLQQAPPAASNSTASNATGNATTTARAQPAAAAAAAAAASNSSAAAAEEEDGLNPEDIQDMICSVQSYSPVGLTGINNITCRDSSRLKSPFGNLTVPLVFHGYRWPSEQGMLLPPMWDAVAAACNLVDVTNKYFEGSSIQFELREVRTDPSKYPYLLFNSLAEWQQCSRNDEATDQGMACLREQASHPNVSSLTADYVINIFLTGSSLVPIYCKESDPWYPVCNSQALGFANPYGPWFGANSDPNWREGLVTEEWFWMQYDMFAPHIRNGYRFWDAGACTMAHELAHYLGLRHTHQGNCGGNGVQATDAVPDTPANMEFWTFADTVPDSHLVTQLQEWCSMFREGQEPRPQMRGLTGFSSCPTVNPERAPGDLVVDNVFNMMSYLPDACCMAMSRGQIMRMQEVIMQYRPGMVARHSTGAL